MSIWSFTDSRKKRFAKIESNIQTVAVTTDDRQMGT